MEGNRPGPVLQSLLPRVPATPGALLPCIRVVHLRVFEAECQERLFSEQKRKRCFFLGHLAVAWQPKEMSLGQEAV